ncbi:hypothetical protein LDENG_00036400, partial [Lucifuga dentata]
MMLSLKQKGANQILRYSEIHVHFSKIQLFTIIVKILSFVMKNLILNFKKMQNRSIFTVVSDLWT